MKPAATQPLVLFIDANVLLSFYHMSSDDLEEIKKLIVLVKNKKVTLLLPAQVIAEYRRNRASKIADAMKRLREQKPSLQFPQLCRGYPEYSQLRTQQREYETTLSELVEKLEKAIESRDLLADHAIDELIELGHEIPTTDEIVARARLRMELGNPPGKKGSLGDAINWESVKEASCPGEDLHFVSGDGDFAGALNSELFNEYLLEEWDDAKGSSLLFYKRLSDFFRAKYPEIKLASEYEKDELVSELACSTNFARTHTLVARLSSLADFSDVQAEAMANAVIANNQVNWILGDEDVREFVEAVLKRHRKRISPDTVDQLQALLEEAESESEDESAPDTAKEGKNRW